MSFWKPTGAFVPPTALRMGIGLTAFFGLTVAQSGQPPFKADAAFVFQSLAAVLVICALAALFGIRRVAKLEPAIVFRG